MNKEENNMKLIKYIKEATSPFHVVNKSAQMLAEEGFIELDICKPFQLTKGGKYYVTPYKTSLFAFTIGEQVTNQQKFHMAAAHTDHPCLHVKPVGESIQKGYLRVNIEVYGGPILNTWLDRPLSIAGRVSLKSKEIFQPELRYVDFKRPVLTIPNLAIHMNREVNKGVELKKQSDMLPVLGMINESLNENTYFIDFLAKELGVEKTDILDFDLFVYCAEEGSIVGMENDFLSCPRLDNLTSCYALIKAIKSSEREAGINLIALYDNEEIGNLTKQGADSALLRMLLEKIYASLGFDRISLDEAILKSFLLSVDVAHALHPNHLDKYDMVNFARLNDGVTLKISSNQKYTFDTEAIASIVQLCEYNSIKYKKYVNHSDMPGGGTLGPVISSWLPMKTVDIGVPILAMHSARELMGAEDQLQLENLVTEFFRVRD